MDRIPYDTNATEEQQFLRRRILRNYRKAVRRDFFRRKAIEKKIRNFLLENGVFTDGDRFGAGSEQSVAVFKALEKQSPTPDFLPPNGAESNLSRKAMPARDDENKGRTDYPPSSSEADTFDGYSLPPSGQDGQLCVSCEPPGKSNPILK